MHKIPAVARNLSERWTQKSAQIAEATDCLSSGNDTISSAAGNDTITSGGGDDTIDSGDGADAITAAAGNDTINAGAGNDTLDGGTGADVMDGGAGTNRFLFATGDVAQGETVTFSGTDTFQVTGTTAVDFSLLNDGGSLNGLNTLLLNGTAGSQATFVSTQLTGVTAGVTTNGSDFTVNASSNNGVAINLGGITLSNAADGSIINGGTGADTITATNGADSITGAAGSDQMQGGAGNDVFLYTNEAELENGVSLVDAQVNGGTGTNRISVAGGLNVANTVSWAAASLVQELFVTGTNASNIVLGLSAQTAGINTVDISTATAASTVDVSAFTATGVTINGGTAADALTGGNASDTISGAAGNALLMVELLLMTSPADLATIK